MTAVLRQQLPNGGKIRTLFLKEMETMQEIAERMRSNPLHGEFEKAIEDYRKIANAVPDAD